jgi:hypothetical protein
MKYWATLCALLIVFSSAFARNAHTEEVTVTLAFEKGGIAVELDQLIMVTPRNLRLTGTPGSTVFVIITVNPLMQGYQLLRKDDEVLARNGGSATVHYLAGQRSLVDTVRLPDRDGLRIVYHLGERFYVLKVTEMQLNPRNGEVDPSLRLPAGVRAVVYDSLGAALPDEAALGGARIHRLRYGQSIRCVAEESSSHPELRWLRWVDQPGVDRGFDMRVSEESMPDDTMQLVAIYKDEFRVLAFEYCADGANDRWVSVIPDSGTYPFFHEEVDLTVPTFCSLGFTATFRIVFNQRVDEASIRHFDTTRRDQTWYNVIVKETSTRYDYRDWDVTNPNTARTWYVPLDHATHGWTNYRLAGSGNVLWMDMVMPKPGFPNDCVSMITDQHFDITLLGGENGVKSITGAQLESKMTVSGRTILLGMKYYTPVPTSAHLALYPNPTVNTLRVVHDAGIVEVNVFNAVGSRVLRRYSDPVSNIDIDASQLAPGCYHVVARTLSAGIVRAGFVKL